MNKVAGITSQVEAIESLQGVSTPSVPVFAARGRLTRNLHVCFRTCRCKFLKCQQVAPGLPK